MLKTYQFKTNCKGESHSSKTANIILPGLMIKQSERPYDKRNIGLFKFRQMSCFNNIEF